MWLQLITVSTTILGIGKIPTLLTWIGLLMKMESAKALRKDSWHSDQVRKVTHEIKSSNLIFSTSRIKYLLFHEKY